MSTYMELVQAEADLRNKLAGYSEKGALSAEEAADFDATKAQWDKASADLSRVEAARAAAKAEPPARSTVSLRTTAEKMAEGGEAVFASFGHMLQACHAAVVQRDTEARQALNAMAYHAAAQGAGEAVDADGGFLVGTDMLSPIERQMMAMSQIIPLCRELPISASSNSVKIPVIDETSRATGSRWGGVQGYWVDAGTPPTATKPKLAQVRLELNKVAALGYATDELLADAAAIGSIMTQSFAEELAWLVENSIVRGTGAGQPLGILNAPALVSVSAESGQLAATILGENIGKMWARVPARNRGRAVWLYNQDCEPQLDQMAMVIGTGGVPYRFVDYGPDGVLRIKGRPAIPVEYCSTLGTVGDLICVDLGAYLLATKGGVQAATSMHVAFTTDEMAFRAVYRVDGQPAWRSAVTPANGSNTLSPYVALATRS